MGYPHRVLKYVWDYQNNGNPQFVQTFKMPKGAKVLTAQQQKLNGLVLWAEGDYEAPQEVREFWVVGWEATIEPTCRYIATVQDGLLVWHIYEKLAEPPRHKGHLLKDRGVSNA